MCWYKPFLRPMVSHFIAGETVSQAMAYGKKLQRKGIFPIFDILGEGAEKKEVTIRV